jgi:hypothetical protein
MQLSFVAEANFQRLKKWKCRRLRTALKVESSLLILFEANWKTR